MQCHHFATKDKKNATQDKEGAIQDKLTLFWVGYLHTPIPGGGGKSAPPPYLESTEILR